MPVRVLHIDFTDGRCTTRFAVDLERFRELILKFLDNVHSAARFDLPSANNTAFHIQIDGCIAVWMVADGFDLLPPPRIIVSADLQRAILFGIDSLVVWYKPDTAIAAFRTFFG